MDILSSARELIVRLLLYRCHPAAELAEFVAEPPDHYTLRIDLPGEIGKTLIVSRRLVDGALTSPVALRSLRLLLRSEVLGQRSRRAVDRGHEASVLRPAPASTEPLAKACEACGQPIMLSDALVVREARLFHRRCLAAP